MTAVESKSSLTVITCIIATKKPKVREDKIGGRLPPVTISNRVISGVFHDEPLLKWTEGRVGAPDRPTGGERCAQQPVTKLAV